MQKGDAELGRPCSAIPQPFEPSPVAPHSRTGGAMHCARIAWAQCGRLSIGRSEIVDFVAHIWRGTILDILRSNESVSRWFVVKFILLGVGAPSLHRYGVQRVLLRI